MFERRKEFDWNSDVGIQVEYPSVANNDMLYKMAGMSLN